MDEEKPKGNFVQSRQKNKLLEYNGYLFNRDRCRTDKSGEEKSYWGCLERQLEKCPCRVVTNSEGLVISFINEHTHQAEHAIVEKYNLEDRVKKRIKSTNESEVSLKEYVEQELANCSEGLKEILQVKQFMAQIMLFRKRFRHKRKMEMRGKLKKQAEQNPQLGINPKLYESKIIQYFQPSIEPEYVFSLKSLLPTNINFNGYLFMRDRVINDKDYWRCYEHQKIKCPARLQTENGRIISQHGQHNHQSDPHFVAKMKLDYEMRQEVCSNSSRRIKDIIDHALNNNPHLADLYNRSNLEHLLCRVRKVYKNKERQSLEDMNSTTTLVNELEEELEMKLEEIEIKPDEMEMTSTPTILDVHEVEVEIKSEEAECSS